MKLGYQEVTRKINHWLGWAATSALSCCHSVSIGWRRRGLKIYVCIGRVRDSSIWSSWSLWVPCIGYTNFHNLHTYVELVSHGRVRSTVAYLEFMGTPTATVFVSTSSSRPIHWRRIRLLSWLVQWWNITLQHAATRCNTLQHAAARCNTLNFPASTMERESRVVIRENFTVIW